MTEPSLYRIARVGNRAGKPESESESESESKSAGVPAQSSVLRPTYESTTKSRLDLGESGQNWLPWIRQEHLCLKVQDPEPHTATGNRQLCAVTDLFHWEADEPNDFICRLT